MRLLILAATLAALAAGPVMAKDSTAGSDKMKSCAASWNAMSAAEKKATTHNAYTSKCMKGSATAPAAASTNKSAMATPAAASTNKSAMSASSAGKPASAKATMAPSANSPQGATARCKDGSYSHAANHTGACSNHGGVANWIK